MGTTSSTQYLEFFGVSTGGSTALTLFPAWATVLGVQNAKIRGVDLPLGDCLDEHRAAVLRLKQDSAVRGALVTSHKLTMVRAAHDLIDRLTPEARLCGEVSALYKRGHELWGHACDPANCGRAMQHIIGSDWWRKHPEAGILSLGGGGATVALLVHLLTQTRSRPRFVSVVEKRLDNLIHCQNVANNLCSSGMQLDFVHSGESSICDTLVADLPPHSLVINATGMGKDIPGSPVTGEARFPRGGAVWELNYRGERPFLHQARSQAQKQELIVEDGWHYFLYGWSSVMSLVFDTPLTSKRFEAFAEVSR